MKIKQLKQNISNQWEPMDFRKLQWKKHEESPARSFRDESKTRNYR